MKRQIRVKVQGKWHIVEVEDSQSYPFRLMVDGVEVEVEVDRQSLTQGLSEERPKRPETPGPVGLSAISQEDRKVIRSPMPGRIVSVSVKVWDEVSPGTEICVLETMKMEQSVRVSQQGIIRVVFIRPGQNVSVAEPLVQLE